MMRTKIAMLYLGGTWGMGPKDQRDKTSPLVPRKWKEVEKSLDSMGFNFGSNIDVYASEEPLDSSHMNAMDWVRIARQIRNLYNEYDGFIIIQGTDTMAYTTSALSFIFENLAKPVVVTGSMLPVIAPNSDALPNLKLALRIVQEDLKNNVVQSVKLAFANAVLAGCRATKTTRHELDAFEAPKLSTPKLMPVNDAPLSTNLLLNDKLKTNIIVIPCIPGINGEFYSAAFAAKNPDGVILQTFESGNVPNTKSFEEMIRFLEGYKIPTLAVSQTLAGNVRFGSYDSSSFLARHSVMSGADMTLEAALTKMMVMLGKYTGDELKQKMTSNLRGELTP